MNNLPTFILLSLAIAFLFTAGIFTMSYFLDITDRYNKSETVLGQWEDEEPN